MHHPFVVSQENHLGIGKLLHWDGQSATVEYFRSPADMEPIQHLLPFSSLRQKVLASQTRVYWQDQNNFSWKIGRILHFLNDDNLYLVRFPNDDSRLVPSDDLKVRCNLPIVDPTDHLAYQLNETAYWHSSRSNFVEHLLEQKRSNLGLTALVSSSIELVAHQISVVRKVLHDPFHRYLLADEVGLGKTIEAGVLIKQFLLDQPLDHETLIIVPETLLIQWQQELTHRFHLGPQIGQTIHIVSNRDISEIRRVCPSVKMIVIDEAHHLCSWAWSSDSTEKKIFDLAREAVNDIQRKVLLLSATPVLHNEKSFLAMLHLLDPQVYPLTSLESFKTRVRIRQEIAECMLSLTESESNYFLADALEELDKLLVTDDEFQSLRSKLAVLIDQGVSEDDANRNSLIRSIRSHVSDVWQLHRRIIRNRRTEQNSVYMPGRDGVEIIEYECEEERGLCDALDSWRLALSASCFSSSEEVKQQANDAVRRAEELAATEPSELIAWASTRQHEFAKDVSKTEGTEGEQDLLNQMIRAAKACGHTSKLQKLLSLFAQGHNVVPYVLFTDSKATADIVFKFLKLRLPEGKVLRHSMTNDDWRSFRFRSDGCILICDREAEEGLNLQRSGAVAIHFDLPFSPNRIEQRMGRIDRFGHGKPVQTKVLVSSASKFQRKWFELVDRALGVFNRSIATLQYVIEDELNRIWKEILELGADALEDAICRLGGDEGRVSTELKRIRAQDALDAVEPDQVTQELADKLELEDFQLSRKSPAIFSSWLEERLKLQREGESSRADEVFSYRFCRRVDTRNFHRNIDTLMPQDEFENRFTRSLDDLPSEPPTRYVTVPLTFDRVVSQERSCRLLRTGDPLIDGFDEYTRWDDRGVCFAFWRHYPRYPATEQPDVFFRIDYVLSPDPKPFEELCKQEAGANLKALIRRGMAIMQPVFKTLWMNSNLESVKPRQGGPLATPFTKTAAPWGRDYNLNGERWNAAARHYDMSIWRDLCFGIRRKSEELFRVNSKISELCEKSIREAKEQAMRTDQQFSSRISNARGVLRNSLEKEREFEKAVLEAQIESFSRPAIRVDSIGAVFISRLNPFSDESQRRGRGYDE